MLEGGDSIYKVEFYQDIVDNIIAPKPKKFIFKIWFENAEAVDEPVYFLMNN